MRNARAMCGSEAVAERPAARARFWMAIAVVLFAAYAVPIFVPPAAAPAVPMAPDASLAERLFPGVPGWWVLARLLCLVAGAALIMWLRPSLSRSVPPPATSIAEPDHAIP